MTFVCFTMDNLGDAADLGRGVISEPRPPGHRPALEQGFPALLALYRRFGIPVTHFIEGWSAQAYPEYIAMDLADGHTLGMHGWQHELWSALDYDRALDIATRATDAIEKAAGNRPVAFRAPGGKRSRFTSDILTRLGYTIDASLCPTGQDGGEIERLSRSLWSAPYEWMGVDASHWLWQKKDNDTVARDWCAALDQAAASGKYFIFIWHPHVMGISPERLQVGERILEYVCNNADFTVATLEQLISRKTGI